jgi:signal peptidase II
MQRTRRTPLSESQQPEPVEPAGEQPAGSGLPEPSPTGGRRIPLLFVVVAVLTLAVDQITKAIALDRLEEGVPKDLLGPVLRFYLVKNPGAAFSLATGYTVVLTVIAVGVAVAVVHLSRRLRSIGWTIAFGLLLGGALGNLSDRFFREPAPLRGHVVDFLQFPHWPIFNLADTSIVIAACLMVLQTLRGVGLDGSREHRGR